VDTAAVSPVARPPRERVTLTALQWELLVNADGQRTPADLALLLGKAGYATIQELRRLAALGLIELPEVRTDAPEFVRLPRASGTSVDIHRPVISSPPVTSSPPAVSDPVLDGPVAGVRAVVAVVPAPPEALPPDLPAPDLPAPDLPAPDLPQPDPPRAPEEGNANGTVYRPPRLARRKPGAKLPKELAGEPPQVHPGTDEVLLKRIRTALRALR
jgi:hypothetical protein